MGVGTVKPAALLLLVVSLAGCAQSSAASSSLDRFNTLAKSLRSATRLSSRLAVDVRAINRGMAHNNRRWIGQSSARLGRDSAALARMSLVLQRKVARIMEAQSAGVQRQYMVMTLGALRHQQWEAHWARLLANTIRRDPLLLSLANYHAALARGHRASRAAALAIGSVLKARALAAHHPLDFGATSSVGGAESHGGQAK